MKEPFLPEAATENHIVVFGMTGAGKSSVIRSAIVEPDLEAERRVLVVTPKDDWWGLRLSRTGKSKGFDIPIFGGFHADYPLNVKDAALLAEAYGTMKGSAIFCTAKMSVTERTAWFTTFAETLLTKNKGRVRVVIDEAHVFMPKSGGRADVRRNEMLNAGNELVSSGRSQGLRIVLASQRSAKLHNDASTQCKCLIAMQLMAPHDRDAVKDWIEDVADPEQGKAIVSSLADLKAGEAWVWAPRAKMLDRVQFPRPATFDSSKPPDDDAGEGPALAPVNLDALQGKLATVEAQQKANDPKALRQQVVDKDKRIAALEQQIAAVPATSALDPEELRAVEQKGFDQAKQKLTAAAEREVRKRVKEALLMLRKRAADAFDGMNADLKDLGLAEADLSVEFEPTAAPAAKPVPRAAPSALPRTVPAPRASAPRAAPAQVDGLTRPQMRVLRSLRMWGTLGHLAPSREMVAAGAGYSPGSGGFNNLIGGLSTNGFLSIPQPGRLSLLAEIDAPSVDEGRESLLSILSNPHKKLVAALNGAGAMTRDALAEATGYSPGSGGFNNLIGKLNTLGISHVPAQGQICLSEWAQELLSGYEVRAAA